jgi:hypothetical protein
MIDDSFVTDSRDLLNPSANTYSTNFGNSVESLDLITPQSAVNNLPVVGTSQETIDIEAQAVSFNNSLIPLDTLLFPQSAQVLTSETVSCPTLPEASARDLSYYAA